MEQTRSSDNPRRVLVIGFILALILLTNTAAPAQNLKWAKRAGGTDFDAGFGIAVDGSGNSYVTGNFRGSATFGEGEANQTTLMSAGDFFEIFVAKYDPSGALVWAKRAGGTGENEGHGIVVDGLGNSYVTGYFIGSTTFGAGEANQTTLISAGGFFDIFVAKYDSSGALVWAKRAGGTNANTRLGIAVDGSGNSYVTGLFSGSTEPGEANQTTLMSAGGFFDIFVAKYDSSGALVWAKQAGGTSLTGSGVAVDGSGNSYVTGNFLGSATFGEGEANQTTLMSAGGSFDIFVAKYDLSGALIWAKRAGGTSSDEAGTGIAADGSANSYVTGRFSGVATFGEGEANQATLMSAGGLSDVFVAKYDSSGALVWAKRAGGTGYTWGSGIAVDGSGNSYVTGSFLGSATFGAGEANQTILTSAGSNDMFVAKYDSSGALVWAKRAGGTGENTGYGIAVDGSGNSYATGRFSGVATFGEGEGNQTALVSAGSPNNTDIFVAKFAGGSPGVVNCATDSLQSAINAADPGETINVTGTCSENILIRNDKIRLFLNGGGTATINGPDSTRPGLDVRGKAISIQRFLITGGSSGFEVQRGANALIDSNVIDSTGGHGVVVNQLAFAVLTNNMIQNNEGDGVVVKEGAAARIGFNSGNELAPIVNTIQMNSGNGITIAGSSSARVVGADINNNGGHGIQVISGAQADVSTNSISSNGGDGINVTQNSSVQLGEDPGLFAPANSGTNNAGFGIRCDSGGALDGLIGSLTGFMGPTNIDPSCPNSLSP